MIIWIWKIWMEMMKRSNYRNDENTNFPVIDGKRSVKITASIPLSKKLLDRDIVLFKAFIDMKDIYPSGISSQDEEGN